MALHFKKLQFTGLYNNLEPIAPSYNPVKKELKSNDFLKLYGALTLIARNNKENLQNYFSQSMDDVIESASISDDELYLYNFEGYDINERYTLKTLYLTENDNVIMSVYDNKKDTFHDFIA